MELSLMGFGSVFFLAAKLRVNFVAFAGGLLFDISCRNVAY